MGKQLLQKYKDIYAELGFSERALNEAAEDFIEDMTNAKAENVLCEKCLDILIKYTLYSRVFYRVFEVNRAAGIEHVKRKYPELERNGEKDCRFILSGIKPEEALTKKATQIYWVSDYATVADMQLEYVKERIKGASHKEAMEVIDNKYGENTLIQKNRLVDEEKAGKAEKAKSHKKTSH